MHLLKMFTLYRVYEAILVHSCVRPEADIAHTADPLPKASRDEAGGSQPAAGLGLTQADESTGLAACYDHV